MKNKLEMTGYTLLKPILYGLLIQLLLFNFKISLTAKSLDIPIDSAGYFLQEDFSNASSFNLT